MCVEIRMRKSFILIFTIFCSLTLSSNVSASTNDTWIKGFGPIEFGQECSDKTKKFETFKIDGFYIKAKCFKYKGVDSGKVFFISVSTNSLSAEAAKNMITEKISPKLREIGMEASWRNFCLFKPDFADCSTFQIPSVADVVGKDCYSIYKNSIKINNFHDVPQNAQRKAEMGLVELNIWSPELECLEKKQIDFAKTAEKKKSMDNEIESDIGKKFMEKLK